MKLYTQEQVIELLNDQRSLIFCRAFEYSQSGLESSLESYLDGAECPPLPKGIEMPSVEQVINYIENDAEVAMPINELMHEDGSGLTKREYGHVLLKYLTIELREKLSKLTNK